MRRSSRSISRLWLNVFDRGMGDSTTFQYCSMSIILWAKDLRVICPKSPVKPVLNQLPRIRYMVATGT